MIRPKHKMKPREGQNKSRGVFPTKKEEINVSNRIYKDSDYFPQE